MLPGLPSWQMWGGWITSLFLTFRATVRMSSSNQAYQSHHRSCPWPSLSEPPRRGSLQDRPYQEPHPSPSCMATWTLEGSCLFLIVNILHFHGEIQVQRVCRACPRALVSEVAMMGP